MMVVVEETRRVVADVRARMAREMSEVRKSRAEVGIEKDVGFGDAADMERRGTTSKACIVRRLARKYFVPVNEGERYTVRRDARTGR